MTGWEAILIVGMVVVTFGVRYPVLALMTRFELPRGVLDALKFIPPAVLTAIIAPAVLMPSGSLELRLDNAYLVAGVVSAVLAWKTRNLLLTIVVGMVVFLAWRAVSGLW